MVGCQIVRSRWIRAKPVVLPMECSRGRLLTRSCVIALISDLTGAVPVRSFLAMFVSGSNFNPSPFVLSQTRLSRSFLPMVLFAVSR